MFFENCHNQQQEQQLLPHPLHFRLYCHKHIIDSDEGCIYLKNNLIYYLQRIQFEQQDQQLVFQQLMVPAAQ